MINTNKQLTQQPLSVQNILKLLLKHRCGNLTAIQEQKVRSLSISQLESLGEALLDFQNMSDLENWLQDNRRLP